MASLEDIQKIAGFISDQSGRTMAAPPINNPTPAMGLSAPVAKVLPGLSRSKGLSQSSIDTLNTISDINSKVSSPDLAKIRLGSTPKPQVAQDSGGNFWDKFVRAPVMATIGAFGTGLNYLSAGVTSLLTPISTPIAAGLYKLTDEGRNLNYWDSLKAANESGMNIVKNISQGQTLAEQSGIRSALQSLVPGGDNLASNGVRWLTGFAADLALDPTSYLGGAAVEKIVGKAGEAELTKFGVKAFKDAVAEATAKAAQIAGKELDIKTIQKIQQDVTDSIVEAAKTGGKDKRFASGGIRVLGTDYVIPGTKQLTNAGKVSYETAKNLIQYIPGIKQTKQVLGSLFSKYLESTSATLGKYDKFVGRVSEQVDGEVAGFNQTIKADLEELTGRKAGQGNVFTDNISTYGSRQEFKDAVINGLRSVGNSAAKVLTDAEEAAIQFFRGDNEVIQALRPYAASAANNIYTRLNEALKNEVKAGVKVDFTALSNYFPQIPKGKTAGDIKLEAGNARSILQQKIQTGSATKAEIDAYNALGAIIDGSAEKAPWFQMERTFPDAFAMAAAGYKPADLMEAVTRRLEGSNKFLGQRKVVDLVYDKFGKLIENTVPDLEKKVGPQVADEAKKIAAKEAASKVSGAVQKVIPETTGKLPRDLAGAKPKYSIGPDQFDLTFSNDIDKASFITAQGKKSARDADYLKFVMDNTGWTEEQVRQHGKDVKAFIKDQALTTEDDLIKVPNQVDASTLKVKTVPAAKEAASKVSVSTEETDVAPTEVNPSPQPTTKQISEAEKNVGERQTKITQVTDPVTGAVYELPEGIGSIVNQINKNSVQGGARTSKALKAYDKFNQFTKAALTAAFPAFYVRNLFSGLMNVAMSQGLMMSLKPSIIGDMMYLTRKTLPEDIAKRVVNYGGQNYTLGQLHKYMRESGLFFTQQKNDLAGWMRSIYGWVPGNAAERSETAPRALSFLMGLESTGSINAATHSTKKILYDYSKLSQFEKDTMQRVIPFYAFKRQNLNYWADMVKTQPKTFANIGRAYEAARTDAYKQNEDLKNAYMANYLKSGFFLPLPVGADSEGKYTFLNELGLSIEDFNSSSQVLSEAGWMRQLSQMNPLIKWPLEAKGEMSFFTGDKVTTDDARSQAVLLREMNKVMPDYVDYHEIQKPDSNGKMQTYYHANPQAIILVSNLPTSRLFQTISNFQRTDKSSSESVLKALTGIGTSKVDPNASMYFANLDAAKAMRETFVNMGLVKQGTNGKFYIDTKATVGGDPEMTAYYRAQAQEALNYVANPNGTPPQR